MGRPLKATPGPSREAQTTTDPGSSKIGTTDLRIGHLAAGAGPYRVRVSPYVRTVMTPSGAAAVQIVYSSRPEGLHRQPEGLPGRHQGHRRPQAGVDRNAPDHRVRRPGCQPLDRTRDRLVNPGIRQDRTALPHYVTGPHKSCGGRCHDSRLHGRSRCRLRHGHTWPCQERHQLAPGMASKMIKQESSSPSPCVFWVELRVELRGFEPLTPSMRRRSSP
jgi:hypothetical protein